MSTKYLAAYALASLKTASPSKDDVTKILKSVGIAVDQATLDFTFEAIGTKSVADLVNAGNAILAKNASAPAAGSAAPAVATGAPAAKKEEKKPVVEEEEDDFGMGGLF
eukprot:GILK01012903.1.p1 GENE.GILK01012903.1~~GILK01012903.1.p1  ORF type:complete len:120 (-),score=28.59 GILK01012903.1:7-333(-)